MDGNFLKEKLQKLDIQMIDVAKKLNISPQALQSRLKTKEVSIQFLIDLSIAVNKSVYYFLKGSDFASCLNNTAEEIIFEEPSVDYERLPNKDLAHITDLQNTIADLRNDKKELYKIISEMSGNQKAS